MLPPVGIEPRPLTPFDFKPNTILSRPTWYLLGISSVAHASLAQKGECWTWNQRLWEAQVLSSGRSKGGYEGRMPPWGSQIFQFHAVFGKFWQNCMLAPPLGSWRPLLGEILDPPLLSQLWVKFCHWVFCFHVVKPLMPILAFSSSLWKPRLVQEKKTWLRLCELLPLFDNEYVARMSGMSPITVTTLSL